MTTSTILHRGRVLSAILFFLSLTLVPVHADEFPLFGGKAAGIWKTTVVFGGSWRTVKPNPRLVGVAHGNEVPDANGAISVGDDGNLNFRRGDLVSAPLTLMSELNVRHNNGMGVFVRVRGWYDMGLNAKTVPHGNSSNLYRPNERLNDDGWLGAAKLEGVDIYDGFWYGNFSPGDTKLQLRVGRQTVQWGEGLFYPGINVVNPVDIAWVIMPGATVANAGLLPVGRVYANLAFKNGFSIDGFQNLEFRPTALMGCGTFFSPVDDGLVPGCNAAIAKNSNDRELITVFPTPHPYNGVLATGGPFVEGLAPNDFPNANPKAKPWAKDPSRFDSYGLAGHYFMEKWATEFGVYYSHFVHPFTVTNSIPQETPAFFAPNQAYVEGVNAWAVSAATGIRNVALSGQMTRILGNPMQHNAPTFIEGGLSGIGPYGGQRDPKWFNQEYPQYFSANTTQVQFGGTAQIGHFGLFNDAQITAETAMQWITNFPGYDFERLGRPGNFGQGPYSDGPWAGGATCNPDPIGDFAGYPINECTTDGFGSPFAWGYKLRAMATLPRVSGITFIPIVTFNNDITGWGMDGSVAGRAVLGYNLRMEIRQRYFADIGGNVNRGGTKYDHNVDKGIVQVNFGIRLQ